MQIKTRGNLIDDQYTEEQDTNMNEEKPVIILYRDRTGKHDLALRSKRD